MLRSAFFTQIQIHASAIVNIFVNLIKERGVYSFFRNKSVRRPTAHILQLVVLVGPDSDDVCPSIRYYAGAMKIMLY